MRLRMLVVLVTCFFIVTGVFCQNALAADRVPQPPQYYIYISAVAPNPVLEGGLFYVEIRNQDDNTVQGATVTVIGYDEALTNSNGKAWFIAPSVSEDTVYTITAYKYGYTFWGGSKTITVRNKYLQLLSVPSQIDEQAFDDVWVINQDNNYVWGAKVTFGCKSDYTNIFGKAHIEAPDVIGDQYVTMTATYLGYDSDSEIVYVRDLDVIPATIHVYVHDTEEQPIEGAIVTIEKLTYGGSIGDYSYNVTNWEGHCVFTVYPDTTIGYTDYRFTAYASGFEEDTEIERAMPEGTYYVYLELPQEGSVPH